MYLNYMDCLCPKKEIKEDNKDWMLERKKHYLSAIIDELGNYNHYEDYKKRFELLFEFYHVEELLI